MARRNSNLRFGYLFLAVAIASVLWGIAHGSSESDRGFDLPIVFNGVPEELVITEKSADVVNVRVLASRAAWRDITPSNMEYAVEVEGGRPGRAVYEVELSRVEDQLPRGARIVSRSPASIEVKFERRGRRSVKIRPDLEGEPGEGFLVTQVEVDPPRVWLAGARSDVLRLSEVVTETIEMAGLTEPVEREVRLSLGGGRVWMEENQPVVVRIQIDPVPQPESEQEQSEG